MSQHPEEQADRYAAKKVIRGLDLITYINPTIGVQLQIRLYNDFVSYDPNKRRTP